MMCDAANLLKGLVGAWRFELQTSCAQGRRATRLRYAPTVTALFILKHFPTLLLILTIVFPTVHELRTTGLLHRDCAHWRSHQSISGCRCHFVGSPITALSAVWCPLGFRLLGKRNAPSPEIAI
jgi:hypothetical protein